MIYLRENNNSFQNIWFFNYNYGIYEKMLYTTLLLIIIEYWKSIIHSKY